MSAVSAMVSERWDELCWDVVYSLDKVVVKVIKASDKAKDVVVPHRRKARRFAKSGFSRFSDLPAEIRAKIWNYATSNRVIYVRVALGGQPSRAKLECYSHALDVVSVCRESFGEFKRRQKELFSLDAAAQVRDHLTEIMRSAYPIPPPLLSGTPEPPQVHRRVLIPDCIKPCASIDPKLDILSLGSYMFKLELLHPDTLRHIQHIAVCWRALHNPTQGSLLLKDLRLLPELKEIHLIFSKTSLKYSGVILSAIRRKFDEWKVMERRKRPDWELPVIVVQCARKTRRLRRLWRVPSQYWGQLPINEM